MMFEPMVVGCAMAQTGMLITPATWRHGRLPYRVKSAPGGTSGRASRRVLLLFVPGPTTGVNYVIGDEGVTSNRPRYF
jgi:hypothetical protein